VVRRYGISISAGIEIALYDLRGRLLGVPMCYLLGGRFRDRIKVCYPLFATADDPGGERNVERVGRMLDLGFDLFRYYCGPSSMDVDERVLKGIRQTYGDRVSFKSLDMSGQFTWQEAVKAVNRLEPYGFVMVETPCASIMDTVRVRDRIGLPVSEHVHSLERARLLVELKAADIFNILVTVGGLEHARKLFSFDEIHDIKTLIGTTQELSIGSAAQAHLGCAVSYLDLPSDPAGGRLYREDVVVKRVYYQDGYLMLPDGPGVGLDLDETGLRELTCPLYRK